MIILLRIKISILL